ncbi:MAG: ammonium transporter, partial [Synechococcales cyanobacterium T60_A2020_003]|nr:ammonium transporter [Synechococcales cyanobacterium T60_A2020_003]
MQLLGVVTVGLYAFSLSYLVLWGVNRIYPLRVTADQERIGLNISEHGASTAIQDLLSSMNTHSLMGDFTQPVIVEPETDVTLIANHYNRVLDTMNRMQADLSLSHDRLLKILNSPAFPVIISNIEHGIIQSLRVDSPPLCGVKCQD